MELVRLTSGLFHEPRLFNSGIDLPLEHPAVHAAILDEPADNFILAMEDLTARGADPRDAKRPLTVDQGANALRGLARLHARFWGQRSGDNPRLAWLEAFQRATSARSASSTGRWRAAATGRWTSTISGRAR
ncbi:hypothetical protein BH09ACT8_BH09ACT8_17060 [soil metagenome]